MTALGRLNAWRDRQRAQGYRIGAAEEILWLCGQLDEAEASFEREVRLREQQ